MAKQLKPIAWRRRQKSRNDRTVQVTFESGRFTVTADALELSSSVTLQVEGQIEVDGSPPSTERAEAPQVYGNSGRRRP